MQSNDRDEELKVFEKQMEQFVNLSAICSFRSSRGFDHDGTQNIKSHIKGNGSKA